MCLATKLLANERQALFRAAGALPPPPLADTRSCYKADPGRFQLAMSGLCCADLQSGTAWAGLRMRAPAEMFLPFLEEAPLALAAAAAGGAAIRKLQKILARLDLSSPPSA